MLAAITGLSAAVIIYFITLCVCIADYGKTTGQGQQTDIPNRLYVCRWKKTNDQISK